MRVMRLVLSSWLFLQLSASALESPLGVLDIEKPSSAVRFSVQEHALFAQTSDFNDPKLPLVSVMMNEAKVRAEWGRWTAGVLFTNRLSAAEDPAQTEPFYLEKKNLKYETANWTLVLGDEHLELGRGLALSLFRDEVLGIDSTLEGAVATWTPGKVRVFGGRVNPMRRPVALLAWENPLFERSFWLAGAEVVRRVSSEAKLQGHYVLSANRPDQLEAFDRRWHTLGGSFLAEGLGDEWDLFLESNVILQEALDPSVSQRLPGTATFGSLVWSPGAWKVKFEAKNYRGFYYDFHRPPSIEEDIIHTINTQDITAGRVTLERNLGSPSLAPGQGSNVRASTLVGFDHLLGTPFRHSVASGYWAISSKASLNYRAGYRWTDTRTAVRHANVSLKFPSPIGQSMELGFRKLLEDTDLETSVSTVDRNAIDFTLNPVDGWSVTLGYEFLPNRSDDLGKHFFNVGTRLAKKSFQGRVFVGQTSGGPQCSGGICRVVPPYTGAAVEASYVF